MLRFANIPNIIAPKNRIRSALALLALALVLAAALWLGGWFDGMNRRVRLPSEATAEIPLDAVGDAPEFTSPPRAEVSEEDAAVAKALNAATQADASAIIAARPFSMGGATPMDRLRALECLAAAVYYEASSEGLEGQRAVAQVVLNRVRHPIYPGTVCDVVFQGSSRITGCQFTFTCDGSLARPRRGVAWTLAVQIAEAALDGFVTRSVGTATHYHADWVAPWWRTSLTKLNTLGAHIFYRWKSGTGTLAAFSRRYRGGEPDPALLFRVEQTDVDLLSANLADAAPVPEETGPTAAPPIMSMNADTLGSKPVADSHGTLMADEKTGDLKE